MAIQAQWAGMTWEVSPHAIRSLEGLSTSLTLKRAEDPETGAGVVRGYELQPLTVEHRVAVAAGGDPRGEYARWEELVGTAAPLTLGGRRFGPPRLQLDQVSLGDVVLSNQGVMLSCRISLSFTEHADEGGKAEEPMQILYRGADIYGDISVNECVHDMYAASRSDELLLRFNDTRRLWDGWAPGREERIEVVDGAARTGGMFIASVAPENGLMTLRAYSIPPTARDARAKSWERVRLLQLGQEIAGRHGLGFRSFGVEDRLYEYARQDNLPDFAFLEQRCALEGAAFLVYDGALVLYGEAALEGQAPAGVLEVTADSDFEYRDDGREAYGTCRVENGAVTGSFTAPGGGSKLLRHLLPLPLEDKAQADRFAAGLLRYANRNRAAGTLSCGLLRSYAAGSVAELRTRSAASWDGPVFLHHIRHNYVARKSKLFFRKGLEGY